MDEGDRRREMGRAPEGEDEIWATMTRGLEKLVPNLVKRTVLAGIGTVFMTEEGIRNVISDMPLPKEIVTYLVQQTNSTKKELFRIIAQEVRDFLDSINMEETMVKVLTSVAFQVTMEVKLVPNEDGTLAAKIKAERGKLKT